MRPVIEPMSISWSNLAARICSLGFRALRSSDLMLPAMIWNLSLPEDPILKKINLKMGLEEGPIPIEYWSNMSPAHPVEDQYRYWSRLVQTGQRILFQIGQDIGPDWSC